MVRSTGRSECPICLGAPVAGRVGHCGHVYCWACILHYTAAHEKQPPPCPVCTTPLLVKDMRPTRMVQWESPAEEVGFIKTNFVVSNDYNNFKISKTCLCLKRMIFHAGVSIMQLLLAVLLLAFDPGKVKCLKHLLNITGEPFKVFFLRKKTITNFICYMEKNIQHFHIT